LSSTAWKDLERRVCRALGAERRPSIGPRGWARGSDDDGSSPFSVEVKRTKRLALRGAWVAQARRQGKADGRPWVLAIGVHSSPRVVVCLDLYDLAQLAQEAGRLGELHLEASETEDGMSEQQDEPRPPTEPEPEAPQPDQGDESSDDDQGDEETGQ
jgi:hypothetical protein